MFLGREELDAALLSLDENSIGVLTRTHDRIRAFADAQRAAIQDVAIDVPGGRAGHSVTPVRAAGCYAPGGRFPLPSSVLMTVVTARAAGVETVWVASPRPTPVTLAAAAIAGADGVLAVGGAQAIAAMALGCGPIPKCDAVVGPGNRWVTAAKALVSDTTRIDMLAGPSELLVIADDSADPATIAADLLAQAEHDPDAVPILVALNAELVGRVNAELEKQLAVLPTADTARPALLNGFATVVDTPEEAAELSNRLAPEHLQVVTREPNAVAALCREYGGLFIGERSAEVFGDYGAGPNHTLPTGGTARFSGGLSVFNFLAVRTWLNLDDAEPLMADTVALARMEGLEGHARAAEARKRR
jgi:phosphoribosyl-ATP pyrophosphohydrolase/phosphoribosyl-AMP cyclohydrolase/histidinol dehydrogenase